MSDSPHMSAPARHAYDHIEHLLQGRQAHGADRIDFPRSVAIASEIHELKKQDAKVPQQFAKDMAAINQGLHEKHLLPRVHIIDQNGHVVPAKDASASPGATQPAHRDSRLAAAGSGASKPREGHEPGSGPSKARAA